jgi:hypothetical protein
MPATDLATLAQFKQWVANAPASADDALLSALITSASGSILSYLQRQSLLGQTFTERYNGYGESSKMLRKYPVYAVTSVLIGQTNVPVQTAGNLIMYGFVYDQWDNMLPGNPQQVRLIGYEFCWGQQNIQIVYKAGYFVPSEAWTVPASGPYTVAAAQLNGPWSLDGGVTYALTGVALELVSSAPTVGQYSVAAGIYTFAAADEGAALIGSYSYVPSPLNQACLEMTSEAYRYRNRIGERSHTLQGSQTVAFDNSRLTGAIKMMIEPYRMVVPII